MGSFPQRPKIEKNRLHLHLVAPYLHPDKTKRLQPVKVTALIIYMVPKARLELARPFEHTPLKRACLPIPPLRQAMYLYLYEASLSIKLTRYFASSAGAAAGVAGAASCTGIAVCAEVGATWSGMTLEEPG